MQLVIEKDKLSEPQWEGAKGCGNGAAVRVEGTLKVSPAAGQKWELMVDGIEIVGPSDVTAHGSRPGLVAVAARSLA